MKKTLYALILTLPLLFTSCGKTGNYGYPSRLDFSNEGGSKEVKGNDYPYSIEIADYDGNGKSVSEYSAGDSMNVTYQWLTIKAKKKESKFTIIAEPKNGGKSRKLYVYADIDPTEPGMPAEIKVVQ
ncbi:hypothetical protein [Alloprevotella tannerae]|jgi:putative lipoprotein|uniref:hypothetical protein n=1 Tax=Alloprevotella tannerae TaxID=76122 RepID=UPI0025F02D7A|nr:hypothetical protein [Alloprevotella tannerae]